MQIGLIIEDSSSLSSYSVAKLEDSYRRARRQAAKQTYLAIALLPELCPYALDNVLAEDWLLENKLS